MSATNAEVLLLGRRLGDIETLLTALFKEVRALHGQLSEAALALAQSQAKETMEAAKDGEGVVSLAEVERTGMAAALAKTNGNVARAAAMLGMGKTTLYRRMIEFGWAVRQPRRGDRSRGKSRGKKGGEIFAGTKEMLADLAPRIGALAPVREVRI